MKKCFSLLLVLLLFAASAPAEMAGLSEEWVTPSPGPEEETTPEAEPEELWSSEPVEDAKEARTPEAGKDLEEIRSPEPDEDSDEDSNASYFWEELSRQVLHTLHTEASLQNDPPKVIDHINFPSEYPDFAFSGEDDLLEIWFPPIRDQDAAIFLYQDQVWMLDCGDERARDETVPLLKHLGIKQIDRIINTHPHHDHLNGLYSIDAAVPVKELLICFPEDSTPHMTAAMEYCKGNGIRVTKFEDESLLSMGDGMVTFLAWMKTPEEESLNDRSAQFMVSYGSCDYLSMADMELHGQWALYEDVPHDLLKADILRYPHHGKLHMFLDLFKAISPSLAIVTNSYRIQEISDSTKFLDYRHVPAAYTHRSNTLIHLTTDGHRWLCEEVPFDPTPYLNSPTPSAGQTTEVISTTTAAPAK